MLTEHWIQIHMVRQKPSLVLPLGILSQVRQGRFISRWVGILPPFIKTYQLKGGAGSEADTSARWE